MFRYRALIAVTFFILLFLFGRYRTIGLLPIILLLAGIGIRVWAAGYVGTDARKNAFQTGVRIVNGPYRVLRHPLYMGNLLLVIAVTAIYFPPRWFFIMIIIVFLVVYSLIVIGESSYIKNLPSGHGVFRLRNARHEMSTLLAVIIVLIIYFARRY